MRFRISTVPFVLILLLPSTLLPAQTNNFVEAWFLYEQGKAKLEDPEGPELGEALLSFQEAIDKRGGVFPEAEMAIGDIYFQEGAFALAKRQYDKAFELRRGMEIAEEKYTILYRLADLHEIQELYAEELPALTLYYPKWYWGHDGTVDLYFTKDGIAVGVPLPLNRMVFVK